MTGIVVSGVQHLRANEACVLARAHEEGIHQMRVAARRLRSALTLYRDHLPEEQFRYLNGELKWLIRELGSARDWDVFVDGVLRPVEGDLTEEPTIPVLAHTVEKLRDEAYDRASAAIKSQRYAGLILLLKAWAEGKRWHDGASKEQAAAMRTPGGGPRPPASRPGLRGDAGPSPAPSPSSPSRSGTRSASASRSCATPPSSSARSFARRQVVPYLAAMKALQDQLGLNNDVEVARGLLKKAPKRARGKERRDIAYAAGLVIGWHSHVSDHREQGALRAWDRFVGRHPFWRPAEAAPAPVPADEPAGEPA